MFNFDNDKYCRVGLCNISLNCYINSSLQCLKNISLLTKYFLIDKKKKETEYNSLTSKYIDLLKNLLSCKQKCFEPYDFCLKIKEINADFYNSPNDPKIFINFFISFISKEKYVINDSYDLKEKYIKKFEFKFEDHNLNLKYNRCIEKFIKPINSIFSYLFYGIIQTSRKCQECDNEKISFSPSLFLELPIINGNKKISYLSQCYKSLKEKYYDDLCENKNRKTKIFKKIEYIILPEILCISLERNSSNSFHLVKYEKEFDASLFFTNKNFQFNYKLIAVINNYNYYKCGHITAYCLNFFNNKWFEYNDSLVSEIPENNVLKNSFAQILFYQKCKDEFNLNENDLNQLKEIGKTYPGKKKEKKRNNK